MKEIWCFKEDICFTVKRFVSVSLPTLPFPTSKLYDIRKVSEKSEGERGVEGQEEREGGERGDG